VKVKVEPQADKAVGRWSDERLEVVVANLLRIGVLVAAALVIAGAIPNMIGRSCTTHFHVFRGEPADLRSVKGIVSDARHLETRGIIQFGLLLLIATPIARVIVSLVTFVLQRDRLYVVVTSIVLAVLLYSLVGTH
jgi:uncharacterized membrane protein